MSFSVQETLFSLLQHNAISGHENAVADVMLCEFRRQAKEVWRDRLGNVVARYGSDKPDALRLMILRIWMKSVYGAQNRAVWIFTL